MKDEEKELKYKIYLKSCEIKQLKKQIKELHWRIDELNANKGGKCLIKKMKR